MTAITPLDQRTVKRAVEVGIGAALNALGAEHGLTALHWYGPDVDPSNLRSDRPLITGLADTVLTDGHDVPAVLEPWALLLGLDPDERHAPGTVGWQGRAARLTVRIWGIVDRPAFEAATDWGASG